ncbi:hypothetical protein [Kitasatospora purpeofusca]|uniref:Uncharacterized protein n=1 Tax=Kitasatospora purpeofusca TaxID=67352 RepID=A0ABZ1UBZ1_9ACTN|nr:hypothetical protein [Kitasatospora purpeofusca]
MVQYEVHDQTVTVTVFHLRSHGDLRGHGVGGLGRSAVRLHRVPGRYVGLAGRGHVDCAGCDHPHSAHPDGEHCLVAAADEWDDCRCARYAGPQAEGTPAGGGR